MKQSIARNPRSVPSHYAEYTDAYDFYGKQAPDNYATLNEIKIGQDQKIKRTRHGARPHRKVIFQIIFQNHRHQVQIQWLAWLACFLRLLINQELN